MYGITETIETVDGQGRPIALYVNVPWRNGTWGVAEVRSALGRPAGYDRHAGAYKLYRSAHETVYLKPHRTQDQWARVLHRIKLRTGTAPALPLPAAHASSPFGRNETPATPAELRLTPPNTLPAPAR